MKLTDYTLWTALITPLTPGLKVDFDSLANLIKEQDDVGNGLLILGSTGEALNLDLETRKSIIEFSIAQKTKSPIMAGIGGHDLPAQRAWMKWLETKNIDGYLLVTPHYSKPGDHGQYQWFKTLMADTKRPCMLYNVPGRTGMDLSLKAVEMLCTHKNYWGIKEASGSVEKMKAYISHSNNKPVFCGDDGLMPDFVAAGACGLISVAANTWPKETNKIVKECLKGSFEAKRVWADAANTLFIASNPIPAKALLLIEGRIASDTMMPPLSRRDLTDLSALKIASTNVRNLYK